MGSKQADDVAARGDGERSLDRQDLPQPATGSLPHTVDAGGRCLASCYACERRGLQERVRFTEPFETLVAALKRIEDGNTDCACEHDDENCCALVRDFCCPSCIAAVALRSIDRHLGQHPIPCATCGRDLTDANGIALVRIHVADNIWACARHEDENASTSLPDLRHPFQL